MAKIRVHQLAKQLGHDSKVILEEARKHGIQLKNHMSSLEPNEEMMLRAFLEVLTPAKPEPVAKPAPVTVKPPVRPSPSGEDENEGDVTARPAAPREVRAGPRVTPGITARPPGAPQRPAARADEVEEHSSPRRDDSYDDGGQDDQPLREVAARRPHRTDADAVSTPPRSVVARPGGVTARPGGVTAQPGGVTARPGGDSGEGGAPNPGRPAPREVAARPGGVQAIRTATARPPRPGDNAIVNRPATSSRRQATILGRKELPPQRPATQTGAHGRSGAGGSGLVHTRSDGGRRTFVNTGRGRGPNNRGLAGGAGGGPRRGGGRRGGRDERRGGPRQARQVDYASLTPDELTVELPMTLKGLSEKLGVKANELIGRLFKNHGKIVKINDPLDTEAVELLGLEFECVITVTEKADVETQFLENLERERSAEAAEDGEFEIRPPIVTFLGHVDHGKTSLLDRIRTSRIANREHGGITQHVGASRVEREDGSAIVFLDTPGHRAFTEMRARGAQVTDVVVLVVAADDGVMPQTKEAIAHAKAAGTPIVVAINKIDRPEANPDKVRQELAGEGLQDEAWGGDTAMVEVSAITGQGIEQLLERLTLEAEILELKANADRPALATVVEAEQSRGEGNVARLLVNDGTLKKGDIFVCGTAYGRIRAIKGPGGKGQLTEAGPSWPVEITGLNELPTAGNKLYVLTDLDVAREIAEKRTQLQREKDIAKAASHVNLENLFDSLKTDTLKIILKVDVTGSLEVLQAEINALSHPEVRPDIIHAAVGGITETDVTLADASDAIILGFHVTADAGSRRAADQAGVEIRNYRVLYTLTEELREALEGRLAPEQREVITGEAEVKKTWKVSRLGTIAGCLVTQGVVKKAGGVRVSRDGIIVHEDGVLHSLRRVKDDVREVAEGFECGLLVQGFEKIQEGDIVIAFEIEKIARTFDSPPLTSDQPTPAANNG